MPLGKSTDMKPLPGLARRASRIGSPAENMVRTRAPLNSAMAFGRFAFLMNSPAAATGQVCHDKFCAESVCPRGKSAPATSTWAVSIWEDGYGVGNGGGAA